MPRFNFKSFLVKNSLTNISSQRDRQSQTDLEEEHGTAELSPVPCNDSGTSKMDESSHGNSTLPVDTSPEPKGEVSGRPVVTTPEPTEPNKQLFKSPVDTSPEPKGQEEKFSRHILSYSRTSTPSARPRKKSNKTEINQSFQNQDVSALMYLEDNNILHPVRHTNEIKGFVPISHPQKLPLASHEVERALIGIKNIPFEQVGHFAQLGDFVRDLHANERICDVTIHIGTKQYTVHRISLACYSDYFAEVFYNQKNKQNIPINIRLNGIAPASFEVLLEYIYSGVLPITPEFVGDLMTMAENLKMPKVKTLVIDYMESLSSIQALAIVTKEKIFGPVYDKAIVAVCEQFNAFTMETVFLDIDIETIIFILSSDRLNISSELDVFKAAIRWIGYNVIYRKQQLLRLMKCVRFPFMTQGELFQCVKLTDLVKENEECRKMILEANWIITARNLSIDDPFNLTVPNPRNTDTSLLDAHDEFYNAFGKLDVDMLTSTPRHRTIKRETWSETTRQQTIKYENWSPLDQTIKDEKLSETLRNQTIKDAKWSETPLAQTTKDEKWAETSRDQTISSTKSGRSNTIGEILVVGGFFPSDTREAIAAKSIDIYHSGDNEWNHYCDLPEPRLHFSVTMLNENVYVTGGLDPRFKVKHPVPTSDGFVFDTKKYTWIKITPMNTARMNHSLVSVNGMVYAIGGQDRNDSVLNTVECYNPKIDKWIFVNPMSEARHSVATGVIDGKIFTVGGYGEQIGQSSEMPVLDIVECFDPQENIWERKSNLRSPRCYGNLVAVNGESYLCGGATRSSGSSDSVISSVHSIEVYNKTQDVWEHCTDMVIPRHEAAAATIGNLIFLIGGASTQSNRILRSVECFDTETKTWVSGVKDLPYPSKWIKCLSFD